jgi:DNA polymerase-3 subunit delta
MGNAGKSAPLVCAVVGADPFLRNEALARLVGAVRDEMDELGPTRCDGSQATAADVLDEVRTPSLLGDRRVVIVEDADDFISANRAALEKYCASPADSGCLILLCDSLPRNTKLYGILAARDAIVTCEKLSGQAFSKWIAQRAEKEYSKRIAAQAVQSLRRLLGDSPGWIDAELAKLSAYVGERKEIAAADVEELTDHRREEKVFAVIHAIADGDAPKALSQLGQIPLRNQGDEQRALGGLAYTVRQYLAAKQELEATGNAYPAAKRMFIETDILQRRLQRLTKGRLLEQQRDLLAADLAVKTGLSTLESAIERFIVKHSLSVRVPQTRTG